MNFCHADEERPLCEAASGNEFHESMRMVEQIRLISAIRS